MVGAPVSGYIRWMKMVPTVGIGVAIGLLAVPTLLMVMGAQSRQGAPRGLVEGRLAPCPSTPNCVRSEEGTADDQRVAPLPLGADPSADWERLQRVIAEHGGELKPVREGYLAATFTSHIFGFVDDVEARRDEESGWIHIRSASRVGRGDLGVNHTRVERLRRAFGPATPGRSAARAR